MTLFEVLAKARACLQGGWTEPFCLTRQGRICGHNDEGVHLFSVSGAVACYATSEQHDQALDLLEVLVDPGYAAANLATLRYNRTRLAVDAYAARAAWAMISSREIFGLASWLEKEGRKLEEVIRLFDRAIAKVRTGASAAPLSWRNAEGEQHDERSG